MNENTRVALFDLETNPDLGPEERHRLANVVRDHIDEIEQMIDGAAKSGADVVKQVTPKGPRARSVLAWQRGSSFSLRIDGPQDMQWLEELISDPPASLRIRPEAASAKRLGTNATQAWASGVRANVEAFRVDELGDAAPGDWILSQPRLRNHGGHMGRALILTFSLGDGLRQVEESEDET